MPTVYAPWTAVDTYHVIPRHTVDATVDTPWTAPTVDKVGGVIYPRLSGHDPEAAR